MPFLSGELANSSSVFPPCCCNVCPRKSWMSTAADGLQKALLTPERQPLGSSKIIRGKQNRILVKSLYTCDLRRLWGQCIKPSLLLMGKACHLSCRLQQGDLTFAAHILWTQELCPFCSGVYSMGFSWTKLSCSHVWWQTTLLHITNLGLQEAAVYSVEIYLMNMGYFSAFPDWTDQSICCNAVWSFGF